MFPEKVFPTFWEMELSELQKKKKKIRSEKISCIFSKNVFLIFVE